MKKLYEFFMLKIIGPIHWTVIKYIFTGKTYDLKPEERENAREIMGQGVYIWLSRRETHLSTYLISLADWLLILLFWLKSGFNGRRPRFGYWSHAFMNYDNNEIVEAVGKGVRKVFFDNVFDCDSIAALRPRNIPLNDWKLIQKEIVEELSSNVGKKYDPKFDIDDEEALSCIELVRVVLKRRVPNYNLKFKHFENMLKIYKNVTPQMLADCDDFAIIWEVRH